MLTAYWSTPERSYAGVQLGLVAANVSEHPFLIVFGAKNSHLYESTGVDFYGVNIWAWVKNDHQGTADFSPCFHLPGLHFETYF